MILFRYIAVLLLLISFSFKLRATEKSINDIRQMYNRAVENSQTAEELLAILNDAGNNDPLLLAYKGATESLIAKHSVNPWKKLQYLDKSMLTLATAIQLAPQNPEIRFLRFAIQYYVPSFLGYSKNLMEDKTVIVKYFSSLQYSYSNEIVAGVGDFMISSGRCSQSEIDYIRRFMP